VGRDVKLAGACSWDIDLLQRIYTEPQGSSDAPDWYRVADGYLALNCDHAPVTERWREIYHDCRCSGPAAGSPAIQCIIRTQSSPSIVRLDVRDTSSPIDPIAFTLRTDPEQRYLESPAQGDWRFLARSAEPDVPVAAFREDTVLMDLQAPWEAFLAHYCFHRALRLQRDVMVFHAASLSMGGKGLMLVGPKGAGKTTISMTLAAMGGHFFGDEFAGIRRSTFELLPFRRALSIREGPATPKVRTAVESGKYEPQVYADGTIRYRIPPSQVLGDPTPTPAPLGAIYFLRDFAESARVTAFKPGLEHLRWLTPLGSSVAENVPSQTISNFLALLRHARCYFIEPGGTPESTAEAILHSLEAA
jgi:hypothetical protein